METTGSDGKELRGVAGMEGGRRPTGVPATPAASRPAGAVGSDAGVGAVADAPEKIAQGGRAAPGRRPARELVAERAQGADEHLGVAVPAHHHRHSASRVPVRHHHEARVPEGEDDVVELDGHAPGRVVLEPHGEAEQPDVDRGDPRHERQKQALLQWRLHGPTLIRCPGPGQR